MQFFFFIILLLNNFSYEALDSYANWRKGNIDITGKKNIHIKCSVKVLISTA